MDYKKNHPGFTLKQFHVAHDQCAMKVGTDGILLGAWAQFNDATRILDVGCGSGLIALMSAQRVAHVVPIDALDIDEDAVRQTRLNVMHSPWPEQISVFHGSLQTFEHGAYSHILSNPPYFPSGQYFSDQRRAVARQTGALTHDQLLSHSAQRLTDDGRLSLILPFELAEQVVRQARCYGLYPQRLCAVKTKYNQSVAQRMLFEFGFKLTSIDTQEITLHQADGRYSEEFVALCQDFYLKMP